MTRRLVVETIALIGTTAVLGFGAIMLRPASALASAHPIGSAETASPSGRPLYYRDPSGKPFYSATPKNDAQGNAYVGVYDDTPAAAALAARPASASAASVASGGQGKILYYRNPMGLPDTSPVPKKDSMGMDYIAVYADEASDTSGAVKISPDKIQALGVRTEEVSLRSMTRVIRAVGRIALDERRVGVVSPRFEGWITKLYVNTTGAAVKRGEPLFAIYSPDLTLAEQEYLIARQSADALADGDAATHSNAKAISAAALARLRNWGIAADDLSRLTQGSAAAEPLVLRAPLSGIVLEKTALEGMRFAPGDTLYRIADLSSVWVIADVFEQDIASVHLGDPVTVTVTAYPNQSFVGKIAFIYPTTDQTTRTTKVRVELPNPRLLLKGDMYATVDVASPTDTADVLALPASAVLDTGARQVVLVDRGGGRFEPRPVKLGLRANDYAQVVEGVAPGENVVVGANFLIDAESNLRAALQNFTAPAQQAKQP